MEPLGHGAIRFRHLGNLREHVPFAVRLFRARAAARFRLQLLGALLHRGSFLVRESLDRLSCICLWAHTAYGLLVYTYSNARNSVLGSTVSGVRNSRTVC